MELKENKVTFFDVVKIAGTWAALFIGAGFATGAEMFQYFIPWGKMAYPSLIFAMVVVGVIALALVKTAGRENFENPNDIIYFYCGKTGGKVIMFFSLLSVSFIPTAIIAGFGATFTTLTGVPVAIGCIMIGAACMITVLLGLRKVVDITGMMGPVIVLVAMFTTVFFLIKNNFDISGGMIAAPELATTKIGFNWWSAAILYFGWVPLYSAPYLAAATTTVKNKKSASIGVVLGTAFVFVCGIIMISSYFTDVETLFGQATPNIYLAKEISPILGAFFVCIVFCAVYSSAAPAFYTICRTLATEKTKKYFIIVVGIIGLSTVIAIWVPFVTLFNIVFTVIGYMGLLFVLMMIVKRIMLKRKEKDIC